MALSTCISSGSTNMDYLTTSWTKYSGAIEENLGTIYSIISEANINAQVLKGPIGRLRTNSFEAQKIYNDIERLLQGEERKIFGYPEKKFKAVSCSALSGVAFLVGLTALAIDYIKDITNLDNRLRWTGLVIILIAAIGSKCSDYMWNTWGSDESEKRMLLELKSKAGIIVGNSKITLEILEKFSLALENRVATVDNSKMLKKTLRQLKRIDTETLDIKKSNFKRVICTLRDQVKKREFRHSQVFDVYPLSSPSFLSILDVEDKKQSKDNQEMTEIITVVEQ